MIKDFDKLCRKYMRGFNPSDRHLEAETNNVERQMYNLLAFKDFLRDTAQPPRPRLTEMLIVYKEWLGLDPLLFVDDVEASFYDAETSLRGNPGGSRPITPIPEEASSAAKQGHEEGRDPVHQGVKKKLKEFGSSIFPMNDKLQALFARKQRPIGSEPSLTDYETKTLNRAGSSRSAGRDADPEALRQLVNSPPFRNIVSKYHGGRKVGEQLGNQSIPPRGASLERTPSRASRKGNRSTRTAPRDSSSDSDRSIPIREPPSDPETEEENPPEQGQRDPPTRPPASGQPPAGAGFSLDDLTQVISSVLDTRLSATLTQVVSSVLDTRLSATLPKIVGAIVEAKLSQAKTQQPPIQRQQEQQAPIHQQGDQILDLNVLSDAVSQLIDERLRNTFSPDTVSQLVNATVDERIRATPLSDGNREWGCAYRSKEHLKELTKFSGSIEDYATFRQQLNLCLERERFRDDKDKALFVYRYLIGPARDLVTHFIRPLDDNSYTGILNRLDWTYGGEKDLDRLLIKKLQKLPKLTSFTQDALIHMIVTIESAIPALLRREPESVSAEDGERLNRLLNLMPQMEIDFFVNHCVVKNRRQNLKGLLSFLKAKFESRKNTMPRERERRSEKHPVVLPSARPKTARNATPGKYIYYRGDMESETDSASEDAPEAGQTLDSVLKVEEPKAQTRAVKQAPCGKCGEPHTLAGCPTFKNLTLKEKRDVVKVAKACIKCLTPGHYIRQCSSRIKCTRQGCKNAHHPLLHDDYVQQVKFFERIDREEDFEASTPCQEEETSSEEL